MDNTCLATPGPGNSTSWTSLEARRALSVVRSCASSGEAQSAVALRLALDSVDPVLARQRSYAST